MCCRVLESNQWQIGELILKGAVRKVDEVETLFFEADIKLQD